MTEGTENKRSELTSLIERHTINDGVSQTTIPSLFFIRYSHSTEKGYRVYNPSYCFIAQGLKEVWLAKERFEYGPADFLVSSMNLPVIGQIIKASNAVPYLSLKLEFTQNQILEVLNESEFQMTASENARRALFVGEIELSLLDATLRLARLLDNPKEIPYLAPIYLKEVLYRLLQSQYGSTIAQIALEGSSSFRIQESIEEIINNFDKPLRIEELADAAKMGISTFHRVFKDVTAMSPIQFQKQIRLQEARRLLLSESADAADVAFRVGYESASQFSREYARMFGSPPKTDIKQLRDKYEDKTQSTEPVRT